MIVAFSTEHALAQKHIIYVCKYRYGNVMCKLIVN